MQHILGLHQPYYERSAPSLFEWLLDASAALRPPEAAGLHSEDVRRTAITAMIRRRHVQSYAVFAFQDSGALPNIEWASKTLIFLKAIKS